MTPRDLEQRRHFLLTMLALLACRYPPDCEPLVIIGIRRLLEGWLGIGRIAVGMARQGYDLQLTRYGDHGWRATFFPAGMAHSITAAVGSAWARTPWEAVQRAAWEGLRKREGDQF